MIQCLLVSNASLTNPMRTALMVGACEIAKSGKLSTPIKTDDFEGTIRTRFARKSLGGYSGFGFIADIETSGGRGIVSFIVSDADLFEPSMLENGRWWSMDEYIEELVRRHALTSDTRN